MENISDQNREGSIKIKQNAIKQGEKFSALP